MADTRLGIIVTQTGADQVKAELLSVGEAGDKAAKKVLDAFKANQQGAREAARGFADQFKAQFDADQARISEGIARSFLNPAQAKEAGREAAVAYNQGVLSQLDRLGSAGLNTSNSQLYRELADGLKATTAAQAQAGVAAGAHGLQLGRLRQEVGTLFGALTGTNAALDRMGGAVGAMGLGDVAVIGALAGAVALTKAWQAWHEEADKAQVEQDKLTDSLLKWYEVQKQGVAGEFPKQIEAMTKQVKTLREEMDKLNAGSALGTVKAVGAGGSVLDAWIRVFSSGGSPTAMISQFAAEVAKGSANIQKSIIDGTAAISSAQQKVRQLVEDDASKKLQEQWRGIAFDLDQATIKMKEFDAASDKILKGLHDQGVELTKLNAALVGYTAGMTYLATNATRLQNQVGAIGARNTGVAIGGLDSSAAQAQRQILRDAQEQSRAIRESVNAAVDLADAFRLVDRNMAQVLASIGRIAANIGPLVEQIKAFQVPNGQGGNFGSVLGLVGAISPVIGGIAGIADAIMGAGDAARQQRAAFEALKQSIDNTTNSIKNQIGILSDVDYKVSQLEEQRKTQDAQIAVKMAAELVSSFNTTAMHDAIAKAIAANDALFKQLEDSIRKTAEATKDAANQTSQQNSHLRYLSATGQTDAAFAYQQFLELQQAIADGLSGLARSELIQAQEAETAQREQQKQTQLLQDQLSTAQQQYDALKQVYDSLSVFKSSLAIGQYSPLSPRAQLDAARVQLNTLYQSALGGDQQAAGQFSGVAQSFLDASRKYNASSAGYVLDFNSVGVMTDKLTAEFGRQMTDAQKQVSLLQQQLDELKAINSGTQILVDRSQLTPTIPHPVPIGSGPRLTASADVAVAAEGFSAIVDRLDTLTAAVENSGRASERSLDALAQKVG